MPSRQGLLNLTFEGGWNTSNDEYLTRNTAGRSSCVLIFDLTSAVFSSSSADLTVHEVNNSPLPNQTHPNSLLPSPWSQTSTQPEGFRGSGSRDPIHSSPSNQSRQMSRLSTSPGRGRGRSRLSRLLSVRPRAPLSPRHLPFRCDKGRRSLPL